MSLARRYSAIAILAAAWSGCSSSGEDAHETAAGSGGSSAIGSGGADGGAGGGSAGSGTGGAVACNPGESVPCYDGDPMTEGQGTCKAGSATCLPDGSLGSCEGQVLPATDSCSTPADEDCDGTAVACTGAALWETLMTSTSNTSQSVHGVAVGATGVYVTGWITGAADLKGTPLDGGSGISSWVAKLDFSGNPLWAKVISSSDVALTYGIVVDGQERVTVAGSFQGDIDAGAGPEQGDLSRDAFVASYQGDSGELRFLKTFTNSSQTLNCRGLAGRPDGTIAITGDFDGGANLGGNNLNANGSDWFVGVFDADGNHIWSKRFGDGDFQLGDDIAFSPDGHVVVSGNAAGTIDFGGMPHTSAGLHDMVIAKLNGSTGARIWSAMYGDSLNQSGHHSVAVAPDGRVILASYAETVAGPENIDFGLGVESGRFFVVSHDPNGNVLWTQAYGGLRGVHDVAVDPAGDILLAGTFQLTVDFGTGAVSSYDNSYDAFVVKLAGDDGSARWAKIFTDTNQQGRHQFAFAIASDATGDIYAAGTWSGATDFGFGEHLSSLGQGFPDGWILHLAP